MIGQCRTQAARGGCAVECFLCEWVYTTHGLLCGGKDGKKDHRTSEGGIVVEGSGDRADFWWTCESAAHREI